MNVKPPRKGSKQQRQRKKLPQIDGTLDDVDQLPEEAWAIPMKAKGNAEET